MEKVMIAFLLLFLDRPSQPRLRFLSRALFEATPTLHGHEKDYCNAF